MLYRGRGIKLERGGEVWMGQHPDLPDCVLIALTNPEGQRSQVRLSNEAMEALIDLYNTRKAFVYKSLWKIIPTESADGEQGIVGHEEPISKGGEKKR
jgi:hypothetical protein